MVSKFSKQDESFGYTPSEIEIIKNVLSFKINDVDLKTFLHACRQTRLCPVRRQIYALSRGGKMTIQTGIDGFRVIAERTGKYSPGKDTEFLYDEKGRLIGAKVYVKKMTPDGSWHDISATAFIQEYNSNQGLWKKMAHVMLEKCAEARVLRRAFPADLSGLYSSEEMDQSNTDGVVISESAVEPTIREETWDALNDYLNGHQNLRKKLKELCNVDDLRNIKQTQLKAVRKYANAYVQAKKDSAEESENKCSADELDAHQPSDSDK